MNDAAPAAAVAGVLALGLVLLLTPTIRELAVRAGLLEAPGGRRIHHAAIPRLGGVAIVGGWYLAVAAGIAVLGVLGAAVAEAPWLGGLLVGTAIVAVAGVVDDIRGLAPSTKLVAQIVAATVAAFIGLRLSVAVLPWGDLPLGPLAIPVTVLWVVGVVNAINLIDGLDGLAAGVAGIASAAFLGIAVLAGGADAFILAATALLGACVAFLRYNLHPATIIMGDTGSMAIGFLLAGLAIGIADRGHEAVSALAPVVVLALPLADTLFAILRRAARRQPISAPDAEHVHHRLVRGGSVRRAVLLLYGAAAALGVLGILTALAGLAVG